MTHKKKKQLACTQKQNEAHHKNLFLKKVLEIASIVSKNKGQKLLTSTMLDHMYEFRCRTLRVVADDSVNLSSTDLQEMKNSLLEASRARSFVIDDNPSTIQVYDFLGPGISLMIYMKYIADRKADLYPDIVEAFSGFLENENMVVQALDILKESASVMAWSLTLLDKRIVSIDVAIKSDSNSHFYTEASIKAYKPEIINVAFEGNVRPAFRVGITDCGSEVVWAEVKVSAMGLSHPNPEATMPVYIQHHAMSRLNERLDCASHIVQLLNMFNSLYDAKCIECNGKKLIEYLYFDIKIGYLVVDVVNGVVLIRTFLLLTHSCTPEGDKLHRLIGLEKPDVNFLHLDKLSTFMQSDIRNNPVIRDLFSRVGCSPLFEVNKRDYDRECIVLKASIIEAYFSKFQEHTRYLEIPEMAIAQ